MHYILLRDAVSGIRVFVEDPDGYPVIQSLPNELVGLKILGMRPSKGGRFTLIADPDAEGVALYDSCFTLKLKRKILRTDMDAFLNSIVSAWKTDSPGQYDY